MKPNNLLEAFPVLGFSIKLWKGRTSAGNLVYIALSPSQDLQSRPCSTIHGAILSLGNRMKNRKENV